MDFEDMLPYVMPSVRGCPEDTAIRELRLAAIEFASKTNAWTETLPSVPTSINVRTYAIALPNDAKFVRLIEVSVAGQAVDGLETQEAAEALLREGCTDSFAWVIDQRDIGINPLPAAAGLPIVVRAVFKPSMDSDGVGDEFAEQYLQYFKHGALAQLLAMPGVAWRDRETAGDCFSQFQKAIKDTAGQVGVGFVKGRLRVKPV